MFYFKKWQINRFIKKLKSMHTNRLHNQPDDAVLKKEIAAYYELAKRCKQLQHHKKMPYATIMEIECYRNAASIDDANAHYLLGKMLLEEAKYRQQIHAEGVFTSEANLKSSHDLYQQAHMHLLAADKLSHVLAKRLRGLAIINGWGVAENKDAGFELIVASIEQEGSWDKVPQIFAEIGLNKPEFFAAIMQRQHK